MFFVVKLAQFPVSVSHVALFAKKKGRFRSMFVGSTKMPRWFCCIKLGLEIFPATSGNNCCQVGKGSRECGCC